MPFIVAAMCQSFQECEGIVVRRVGEGVLLGDLRSDWNEGFGFMGV